MEIYPNFHIDFFLDILTNERKTPRVKSRRAKTRAAKGATQVGEAYVVLTLAATIGVWLASSFAATVTGIIPSALGGGATPNKWVALLVNGAIVAGVVVLAGHLHGKVGREIRRAE